MISCYFMLLMKIYKKQNGQLARPSVPQVLAVSFWSVPFSGYWAGPTATRWLASEAPSPHPATPVSPIILASIPAMSHQRLSSPLLP